MTNEELNAFKLDCRNFLHTKTIHCLRPYGRELGLRDATKHKKPILIEKIIGILTGEITPTGRSNRGAPVRNDKVDERILMKIEEIRLRYFGEEKKTEISAYDFDKEYAEFLGKGLNILKLEDPNAAELEATKGERPQYRGQLETVGKIPVLLPFDCTDGGEKVVVPVELIRINDLREGDIISCYARKQGNALVATRILTVNDIFADTYRRARFDEADACYPTRLIKTFDKEKSASVVSKYLEWLTPVCMGQRGLILSSPKAGKTNLLSDFLQAASLLNPNLVTLAVLVEQPPENVGRFRRLVKKGNLVYTTYEDDPERQVFVADFLLKRAKRLAESGRDVLLVLDSFTALARAYNDTDASAGGKTLAGGMESKTLQYLKKYFGSARAFERGGSLTIIGTVTDGTGNPADDLISSELSALANHELRLSDSLAFKRIYPALDLANTHVNNNGYFSDNAAVAFDYLLRSEYLSTYGGQGVLKLLSESDSFEDFVGTVKNSLKK